MDFTFSDEQIMAAASLRELTNALCLTADVRAAFEARDSRGAQRWRTMAEIGLFGILAPESSGGMGLNGADFVLIAEEAGRSLVPEPLIEHAGICVPLLAELAADGRSADLLPRAATGKSKVSIVHPGNPYTVAADEADYFILCAADGIHLLTSRQVKLAEQPANDASRKIFRVEPATGGDTLIAGGMSASNAAARAFERGAVYCAAECLGLAERMIQLAVEYARQRIQFGKPIGSYQAIKHALATAQVKLEFARPVVYAAVMRAADLDPAAPAAISHAKIAAGDAADLAARTAMQVHGAMGYSWEVDLHMFMKRAWALNASWGDRNWHARRMQALLLDRVPFLELEQTFFRTVEDAPP